MSRLLLVVCLFALGCGHRTTVSGPSSPRSSAGLEEEVIPGHLHLVVVGIRRR